MLSLRHDLRHASRALRRAPGFTSLAVLVLGLGVGSTSAMFALVDAALIRTLPFPDADRLVMLWEAPPGGTRNRVSPLNFVDWSEQSRAFSRMAAVSGGGRTLLVPGRPAERIPGQAVTSQFFDVLRVPPIAGRTFSADDQAAKRNVVVISERLWKSRFGGDPAVIGRPLSLDGVAFTVIGVAPSTFQILFPSDLWTLYVLKRSPEQRQMHYLQVVGRVRPDASLDDARSSMNVVAARIARDWPDTNKGWGVTVEPLRDALVRDDLRVTSLVLGGVVGFVLLMACANVANLLVGRGVGRSRELAVRAALGGSRARLVRELLTESALLAILGGALGLAVAWGALRMTPMLLPPDILPPAIVLDFDWRLAAFTVALTGLSALLAGLAPAWHSARVSLADVLRSAGSRATGSGRRLRTALAIAEVAAAVTLVCGATLLLRTFDSMSRVDAAYARSDVLTMQVALPLARYPTPSDTMTFYENAIREIESIPGIHAAAFGGALPFDGFDIGMGFEVAGDPPVDPSARRAAHYQIVGARYFEVIGIPVMRGRAFTASDDAASLPVCIVSQAFVAQYANGRDPLTLRVSVQSMNPAGPTPVLRAVVGVVPEVSEGAASAAQRVAIYVPIAQNPWYSASLSVRADGATAARVADVRSAIARVDRDQPVTRVRTMAEVAAESIAVPRFRAQLVGVFAAMALVLAGIGIFGVLAFSVHLRTREFGIRMALGAQRRHVLGMVLAEGLTVSACGVGLGLATAAAMSRSLATLLYGVRPLDPATFLAAPLVLGLTALAACAAPALRAAKVESAVALRQE